MKANSPNPRILRIKELVTPVLGEPTVYQPHRYVRWRLPNGDFASIVAIPEGLELTFIRGKVHRGVEGYEDYIQTNSPQLILDHIQLYMEENHD